MEDINRNHDENSDITSFSIEEFRSKTYNNLDSFYKEENNETHDKAKKAFKLDRDIAALEKLIKLLEEDKQKSGKTFSELEDDYYNGFKCYSEKEKISLEIRFILTVLEENQKIYKENSNYESNITYLTYILKRVDSIPNKSVEIVKQAIILIELDFGIPISLYSQVENVYQLKLTDKKNLEGNSLGLKGAKK